MMIGWWFHRCFEDMPSELHLCGDFHPSSLSSLMIANHCEESTATYSCNDPQQWMSVDKESALPNS